MRETTSQMNLRFSSATVTADFSPPERMATVMYGSVSLRKYTGPYHGWPRRGWVKAGSAERSRPEPTALMPRRDSAMTSRPCASISAMSVTSGAWRSSFRNSMRRSSTSAASSCGSAAYCSCCVSWRRYCSMRAAAPTAFSCCRLASVLRVSR